MENTYSSNGGVATETDVNNFINFMQSHPRAEQVNDDREELLELLGRVENAVSTESFKAVMHWYEVFVRQMDNGSIRDAQDTYDDMICDIMISALGSRQTYMDAVGCADRKYKVGDAIRIVSMDDANGTDPQAAEYNGREGVVQHIDDMGQLHGTWGGLAVNPKIDEIELVTESIDV